MLVQEETRLKNQKPHSVHLVNQKAKKSTKKKPGKNKKKGFRKELHNLNESTQIHKKEHNVKCYFCNKFGHLKKDCQKRKA